MSQQRTAVITGAASGIGLSVSGRLARADMHVLLVDRSPAVQEVARELSASGAKATAFVADLGYVDQVLEVAQRVKNQVDVCDVLVNNAGVHPKKNGRVVSLDETTLEDWDTVIRINLTAPFLLCQRFVPAMKEQGWGRIINITSRAGRTYSDRAGTSYSASKSGLIGLTRKIAGDYAPHGITANCVAPGQVETPLARASTSAVLDAAARATPMGRLGTADEIASVVEYLASDAAAFMTGVVVDVNGGIFMG
jgi:3-oxoacyl-[acyl-carrier protein] reductase